MIKDRRVGRFEISVALMNKDPDIVKQIMGNFIILNVKQKMEYGLIEYIAICNEFEEIKEGNKIPFYQINYDSEGQDFRFNKIE